MFPGWLMMTSSPGWGTAFVLQLPGVFHDPLPELVQLAVLNRSRLSSASRQYPKRRRTAWRECFLPPEFEERTPAPIPDSNNIGFHYSRNRFRRTQCEY